MIMIYYTPAGMDVITSFLKTNIVFVFFVYGLAYFSVGMAIALETGRQSRLNLAAGLPFLAAYALLHSVVEWTDMFVLIGGSTLRPPEALEIGVVRLVFLVSSTASLIIFGVRLLNSTWHSTWPKQGWLIAIPPAFVILWLLAASLRWLSGAEGHDWMANADALARYVLYFPGCMLAAIAMVLQRSSSDSKRTQFTNLAYGGAAAAFAFNGIVAGLVVPSPAILPVSITYEAFTAAVGFPVQVLRSVAAVAVAFFLVQILRAFDREYRQELEKLTSERTRLYEELQRKEELRTQLLEKVISAQEEERRRIARELHDEASQALTALIISLESAEETLPSALKEMKERLSTIKGLTLQTLEEIRKIIVDLRPTLLDDLGLVPALRWYTKNHSDRSGIDLSFVANGFEERLPAQTETALFRVVQEAITNITKHSRASHGNIRLDLRNSHVYVIVEDDGDGFDASKIFVSHDKGRGLGLLGMQERVSLLGGTLVLQTQPGKGTRIAVDVPMN